MLNLLCFVLLIAKSPIIQIGVHAPLSGPISEYGIQCLQGIKLAFKDYPEIKLVIKDNEGTVENTTIILREFADEGVAAAIGPLISPNAVIAALETNRLGIPMILPCATNTAVTRVSKYVFRGCFTDKQQAKAISRFVYRVLGKQEVSIVADTSNIYSGALALHFKSDFESMGGHTHIIEWNGQADFSNALQEADGSTVFLPLYYKAATGIIKAARAEGLNITFIGADGLDTPELFETLQEDTQGIYFSTHYFEDENSEFVQRYTKEYHSQPNSFSALGFDAANLILLAIKRTNGTNAGDMFEAISDIETFDGVTGAFRFGGKRDPLKSIFIVQLQKGKTTLVHSL
jgi:branched-chain amino acid transport system substrate-binding protein